MCYCLGFHEFFVNGIRGRYITSRKDKATDVPISHYRCLTRTLHRVGPPVHSSRLRRLKEAHKEIPAFFNISHQLKSVARPKVSGLIPLLARFPLPTSIKVILNPKSKKLEMRQSSIRRRSKDSGEIGSLVSFASDLSCLDLCELGYLRLVGSSYINLYVHAYTYPGIHQHIYICLYDALNPYLKFVRPALSRPVLLSLEPETHKV